MPAHHDHRTPRLFVTADLATDAAVPCTREQVTYLVSVLRLADGDSVLVFNGRDGEWRARLETSGKRNANLRAVERTRPQSSGPDLHYLFAPLKRSRLDYMVQKATELGAARLQPTITHRTIAERVNLDRMRANVVEAAEQCGILRVPEVAEPLPLARLLETWDERRRIVFCDEEAPIADPIAALTQVPPGPLAVLIGPEGGFDEAERAMLVTKANVIRISIGPRIMRADTAAVAALALVNAVLGDWR